MIEHLLNKQVQSSQLKPQYYQKYNIIIIIVSPVLPDSHSESTSKQWTLLIYHLVLFQDPSFITQFIYISLNFFQTIPQSLSLCLTTAYHMRSVVKFSTCGIMSRLRRFQIFSVFQISRQDAQLILFLSTSINRLEFSIIK
jgi:hypothetical protein